MKNNLFKLIFISCITRIVDAITCFKCESYRDYRCLDPFDFRPHPQINCDYEPFAREKKPVFCEKVTDLIDGVYVTTRGCSNYQWEDVDGILDHRNRHIRCIRRGLLERCLCQYDGCNSTSQMSISLTAIFINLMLHVVWI